MPILQCPQCNRTADVPAALPSSERVCPACRGPLTEAPGASTEEPRANLEEWDLEKVGLGLLDFLQVFNFWSRG